MSEIRFGAQEKFVLAHKRNSFWRTRNWFVLRPFFLELQYPQGEKPAHLGILNTEKYGSMHTAFLTSPLHMILLGQELVPGTVKCTQCPLLRYNLEVPEY
jgi:hypothetical protein